MDCKWYQAAIVAIIALALTCVATAQQTANPVTSGEQLPVPGKPVPADHSQLSEHNVEWMLTQPPQ
ncbi:MAG TPA: hypothetical protein VEG68_13730, partial [Terriglobales bacterium]|nr:hypothetical protein [Terriglobales bacterium]